MDILDKIQFLLKDQNKTQKELTDYLGVSKAIFSQWKSSFSKSYLKFLPQIADFFSVSVDYLLDKTELKQTSPLAEARELSDSERELIELVKSLNEDEVKEISRYIDYIISKRMTED